MMRALSLWQPWASLIAVGAKKFETRSWGPPESIGQEELFAIHAGKSRQGMRIAQDSYQLGTLCDLLLGAGYTDRGDWQEDLPFGCIIAVVKLVQSSMAEDVSVSDQERALGDWTPGRWVWGLEVVMRLEKPLPQQGRQGLFQVDWDNQAAIQTEADRRGIILDSHSVPGFGGLAMMPTEPEPAF